MVPLTKLTIFTSYFAFLILFSLCTVIQESYAIDKVHRSQNNRDITLTKLGQHVGSPTLKFAYCYSCGYRKIFDDYVKIITQKYPDINIDGRNFDPPGIHMFLSRIIGISKLLIIICILGGVNIFMYFGQQQPSWWIWCIQNKLYACMMLFLLCNIVEVQLMSTGAFEITLNDIPVWSKLETGRIPQPNELFEIINNHMDFSSKIEYTSRFSK